jgi:hypothetical protein
MYVLKDKPVSKYLLFIETNLIVKSSKPISGFKIRSACISVTGNSLKIL